MMEFVTGRDDNPYMMEHTTCLKPPNSQRFHEVYKDMMLDKTLVCLLLIADVNHGFQFYKGHLTNSWLHTYRRSYHKLSQIASINHQCSWVNLHKSRISPDKCVVQILVFAGQSHIFCLGEIAHFSLSNCNDLTATSLEATSFRVVNYHEFIQMFVG